jgi:hypothetical protein
VSIKVGRGGCVRINRWAVAPAHRPLADARSWAAERLGSEGGIKTPGRSDEQGAIFTPVNRGRVSAFYVNPIRSRDIL